MAFMGLGQVSKWVDLGKEAERRAIDIDDIGRRVAAMTVRAAAQNFHGTPIEAIETGEQVVGLAERLGDRGWLNLALYAWDRPTSSPAATSMRIGHLVAHAPS